MLSITRGSAVRTALLLAVAAGALLLGARSTAAQEEVTVAVGDIWFCDASYQGGVCEIAIDAGDTVVWDFSPAQAGHTTTECGVSCDDPASTPLWDSGVISDGSSYQYTFAEPDTYLFFCRIHPTLQRGRIVVLAPEPTAPRATAVVDLVAPATPTTGPGLPDVGGGPQAGDGWGWLAGVALATSAALALAAGIRRAKSSGER